MKLDKIKFAKVVQFIGICMDDAELTELDSLIDINVEPVSLPHAAPNDVNELLDAFKHKEMIRAIKAYRSLTGMVLKDSKDAVEDFWPKTDNIIRRSKQELYDQLNEFGYTPEIDAEISKFINKAF